jgi:transposase
LVLTDGRWAALEPLLEGCRPKGKTPPRDLRRTIEAIIWRHENGAKWRAVPADLGPWWRAAQLFIRWARLGVWERLLEAVQERGVELGMAWPCPGGWCRSAGPQLGSELARAATAGS